MANYKVSVKYKDGTKRILETSVGSMAIQEASFACSKESQSKEVLLEKDGETLFKESIEAYKNN